jgi:hypothetical protein
MTKLIVAVALATIVVLPATPAFAEDSTVVIMDGKVIGKDPSAHVRHQLRRDYGFEGY